MSGLGRVLIPASWLTSSPFFNVHLAHQRILSDILIVPFALETASISLKQAPIIRYFDTNTEDPTKSFAEQQLEVPGGWVFKDLAGHRGAFSDLLSAWSWVLWDSGS